MKSLLKITALVLIVGGFIGVLFGFRVHAQDGAHEACAPKTLSIEEFIGLATQNDAYFEEILINELTLAYRKDLVLPARDIVVSVKGQYDFMLSRNREDPEASISLSKLFPYTGTEIQTSYTSSPSVSQDRRASEFTALISQPIARNAFGAATNLKDKIVGIETDVMRYQIIEAYEDYLAQIITTYYAWYSAYENLKIGRASYEQNKQLLDNMNKRAVSKIALSVDVNKVRLLVADKKENVILLDQAYRAVYNLIKKAIRSDGRTELAPVDPSGFHSFDVAFRDDYARFTQSSRTYEILQLLEEKSSLEVKKSADDLLPSTKVLLGYRADGSEWSASNESRMVYAGFSLEWPFPGQVERAEYETSQIEDRRMQLSTGNKYIELYTVLRNVSLQIDREKELIRLAQERITLAEAVLEDETRNYSFGKITLNDYIDAVNKVDTHKFKKILHTVELKKLLLEWLRLTDRLVDETVLQHPQQ